MAKNDFIPPQDPNYMTWHDQFKTGVLAQAATFGLVAADTTPITADNTDFHTKITNLNATAAAAKQAVADKNISRRNSEARARVGPKKLSRRRDEELSHALQEPTGPDYLDAKWPS